LSQNERGDMKLPYTDCNRNLVPGIACCRTASSRRTAVDVYS